MALTTGTQAGDMSGCVEMTIGYFGYHRFNSGKLGISFDYTGGSDENVIGKDITLNANDTTVTGMVLHIEQVQLSCGSCGPVAIFDGSAGTEPIVALAASDVSGVTSNEGSWDFRGDPLICLTGDTTQSLCVSSAANGHIAGFIEAWWGPSSL